MNPLVFERNLAPRLPKAETTASQSLDNQTLARQAWLRAMEQSQVSGWFQPFSLPEAQPAAERMQPKPSPMPQASAHPASFASAAMLGRAVAAQQLAPSAGPENNQIAAAATAAPAAVAANVANLAQPASPASQALQSSVEATAAQATGAPVNAQVPNAEAGTLPASGLASALQSVSANLGAQAATITSASNAPPRLLPLPTPLPAQWLSTQTRLVMSSISAAAEAEPSIENALPTDQASAKTAQFAALRETATRTHAVWDQDNLSLWLGMDGTASQIGLQASMLIKTLRQSLSLQGQRLQRVVCNGQLIFDAATAGSAPDNFHTISDVIDRHTSRAQVVASVSSFSKESS